MHRGGPQCLDILSKILSVLKFIFIVSLEPPNNFTVVLSVGEWIIKTIKLK